MTQHATKETEDLNLKELLLCAWTRKWWIVACTTACTIAGIIYIATIPPIYHSQVELLPPKRADLAEYNLAAQLAGPAISDLMSLTKEKNELNELTPKESYEFFIRHLHAYSTRLKFFNEYYLPSLPVKVFQKNHERLWNQFSEQLQIRQQGESGHILSFSGPDSQQNADWANQYVQLVEAAASDELIQALQSAVRIRQKVTEDQIKTLRSTAEVEREAKIKRLRDALHLAQSIHLLEPPTQGNLITSYSDENLYLRGSKALESEIQIIEQRENNDPYIPELNDLLKKQALLNAIQINPTHLRVVNIDRVAEPSSIAIWPRPMLIMALSILGGFGASSLFVLFFSAFRPPRNASRPRVAHPR